MKVIKLYSFLTFNVTYSRFSDAKIQPFSELTKFFSKKKIHFICKCLIFQYLFLKIFCWLFSKNYDGFKNSPYICKKMQPTM